MFTLPLVLAPLLLTVPDRPVETPDTSWVGKIVFMKVSGTRLDPGAEPGDPKVPVDKGILINVIQFRIYAERADHVQVRTREGVNGWLRKVDVVPLQDAVAFFTKQLEANPGDTTILNRRASAFKSIGELDQALKDATECVRVNPNPAYYNNRALIWHAKKDYDKAIADYAQALNQNPQYALVYANRASMWESKKEYDKAIADATQAVQFQPQFPNAYRVRGLAFHGKKEYDRAIADLTKSLELDPKSGQVRAERGNAHAGKGEHDKALDDFNEALRLEPFNVSATSAAALWLASCSDAKYRDGKRALELAQKAQKLERTNTQMLQALAAAHAELGQFKEAVRWQEHALGDTQLQSDAEARARLETYRKGKAYRRE